MPRNPTIQPLRVRDRALLAAHFDRHRRESGADDLYFMPYEADDPDAPRGFDPERLSLRLGEPGWQRWFGIIVGNRRRVVGHLDLSGPMLRSGLHRCELGIGIERPYRGQGFGRELMTTAIAFLRETPSIAWLDLRVFADNEPARRLYRDLGFVEVGEQIDRFRIGSRSIDDVRMTLHVGGRTNE